MKEVYTADRSVLLEFLKAWKESDSGKRFYKSPSNRIVAEETYIAPWVLFSEQAEATDNSITAKWFDPDTDEVDGEIFEDLAEEADEETLIGILSNLGYTDDAAANGYISLLAENEEGRILLVGRPDSSEAYALSLREGKLFYTALEIDPEELFEGAMSMQLLGKYGPAPDAPVYPGFPDFELESKLYEVLHTSQSLLSSLSEDSEAAQLVKDFAEDLASVIAEVSLDEGTLSEKESETIYDAAEGAFAGIQESIQKSLY